MKALRDFLIISRANIQVASLPTALIGPVLAAGKLSELWDADLLLFVALFFVVLTFACNLNCLADAEVDELHKRAMSGAVRSMGKSRIKRILAAEALVALAIAAALAVSKEEEAIVLAAGALAALGLALVYSAPPLRVKGRGWLSPLPVVLGLYALPPLGGWYLVRGRLGGEIIVFALGYALLMEGLTIVNTCEDHPEDASTGLRTLAHAFGIRRTLALGARLTGAGGIIALAAVFMVAGGAGGRRDWPSPAILGLVGALSVFYAASVVSAVAVLRDLARAEDPAAACKRRANLMPAWFLMTRYPLLFMALLLK